MAEGFFLVVGSFTDRTLLTRLKGIGARYRHKKLDSGPANWTIIAEILRDKNLRGAVVKVTASDYARFAGSHYNGVADELLSALGSVKHVVLVHEAILSSGALDETTAASEPVDAAPPPTARDWMDVLEVDADFENYYIEWNSHVFGTVSDDDRNIVNRRFRDHGITPLPYSTNAEFATISGSFVEDNQRNLLFRLYVPRGRLYAQEFDALLALFQDWLASNGQGGVRRETKSTSSGRLVEFFGDGTVTNESLTLKLGEFTDFLEVCRVDESRAVELLEARGMVRIAAERMVHKYSRDARRLHLDLRQEREQRVLQLKHRFENDESELLSARDEGELEEILLELVPNGGLASRLAPSLGQRGGPAVVNNFYGPVAQSIEGSEALDQRARELLELIEQFSGSEELRTALYEFADPDTPVPDRVTARSRLRGFLADLGNRGVGVGISIMQKYLEQGLGL